MPSSKPPATVHLPSPTNARTHPPSGESGELSFNGPLKALRVSARGNGTDVVPAKKLSGLLSWSPEDRNAWPWLKAQNFAAAQASTSKVGEKACFSPCSTTSSRRPISAAVDRHILPAASTKLVLQPGQILAPSFCEDNNGIRAWNGGRNLFKAAKSPLQPLIGGSLAQSSTLRSTLEEGQMSLPGSQMTSAKPLTHVTLTLSDEAGAQAARPASAVRRRRPKSGVVPRALKQISYVDDGLFAVSTAPIHAATGRSSPLHWSAPQLPVWKAEEERSLVDAEPLPAEAEVDTAAAGAAPEPAAEDSRAAEADAEDPGAVLEVPPEVRSEDAVPMEDSAGEPQQQQHEVPAESGVEADEAVPDAGRDEEDFLSES